MTDPSASGTPAVPEAPALRLGARTSPLARAQVDLVAAMLAAHGVGSSFVGVTTTGDVDPRLLTEIGGTGVFASAVRDALRVDKIDCAVHSLKDLPTAAEADLEVISVPAREDVRDVLVGSTLADLPDGARVGTGAPRRAMQLQDWARSQGRSIEVVPVRGNVDTRIDLARGGGLDAVVLAGAGLRRLGYLSDAAVELSGSDKRDTVVRSLPAEVLDEDLMLPAPGQGALALEVSRSLGGAARAAVLLLDDPVAHTEIRAERAFLATLEAGCTAPVGVRARVVGRRGNAVDLTMRAVVERTLLDTLSVTTKSLPPVRVDVSGSTTDPARLGADLARSVLAQLSDEGRRRAGPAPARHDGAQ
ncbi:hydroxymethylbilane synthase [Microlunatus flavus]|uniref:Hydroxymethylbilane synthase n=1 Tax=Microlunatus flavus TaxID=1036181 RepID=A0A1H8Z7X8_9ACTN|nr:hydroxymethylbilane synthase [Microlunatus flavus]SEP59708.1 hydroxymethylbilane synthase [Microlunatus flavus]